MCPCVLHLPQFADRHGRGCVRRSRIPALIVGGYCTGIASSEGSYLVAKATGQPLVLDTAQLSLLELRELGLIASGKTTDTVARELDISTRSVRRHVRDVCDRLGVDTPIEAVIWAAKHNLL